MSEIRVKSVYIHTKSHFSQNTRKITAHFPTEIQETHLFSKRHVQSANLMSPCTQLPSNCTWLHL